MKKIIFGLTAVVGVIAILWLAGTYCIEPTPEDLLKEERKDAEKAFDERRKLVDDLPDCGDTREVVYVVEWKRGKDYGKGYLSKIENYHTLAVEITETAATIRCEGEAWRKDGRRIGNVEYWVRKNKGDQKGSHYAGYD